MRDAYRQRQEFCRCSVCRFYTQMKADESNNSGVLCEAGIKAVVNAMFVRVNVCFRPRHFFAHKTTIGRVRLNSVFVLILQTDPLSSSRPIQIPCKSYTAKNYPPCTPQPATIHLSISNNWIISSLSITYSILYDPTLAKFYFPSRHKTFHLICFQL